MIAFPEFLMAFSPSTQSADELAEMSETLDGFFTQSLREAAKAANIETLATIYEKSGVPGRVYDNGTLDRYVGSIIGRISKATPIRCPRFQRVRQVPRW